MKTMIKYGLLALVAVLLLQACNKTNRSGVDPSMVVPEEDMVKILTDIYLADGLLNYPPIRGEYSDKDSTENYTDVIEKHGYTRQEVDSSMYYYFIDKPDKYKKIYNRVIENLSGMEADVIQRISQKVDVNRNLWEGEMSYSLPDAGVDNPVEFSIPVAGLGEYIIKARITLYEDDESINPRAEAWFWYDDGSEEGKKIPWETVVLDKSGRPEMITLRRELNDPRVTHIRGRLLNHDPRSGIWEKHALVTNINVNYKPEDVAPE